MTATAIIIGAVVGLLTSFCGSMMAFVLWIHFDLEEHWQARKERHRLHDIERGKALENEYRMRNGLPPLP